LNVTQNGLEEWLNTTTIEESANTTLVDGVVSLEGDVVSTILDLIFDSIKNSTEANNGTGWELPSPMGEEQNTVEETDGGENASSNDEGTGANTSGEPLDEDEPVKWEVD